MHRREGIHGDEMSFCKHLRHQGDNGDGRSQYRRSPQATVDITEVKSLQALVLLGVALTLLTEPNLKLAED